MPPDPDPLYAPDEEELVAARRAAASADLSQRLYMSGYNRGLSEVPSSHPAVIDLLMGAIAGFAFGLVIGLAFR